MPNPTQKPALPDARNASLPPAGVAEGFGTDAETQPARCTGAHRRYPYPEEELQREIEEKFALYETLKPGWDLYSADPTNLNSLADARKFLAKRPKNVPLPFPTLGSDGIVGLYWETDHMHVSVGFEGCGLLGYYAKQTPPEGSPRKFHGDDCRFEDGWPPELLKLIREL